MNLCLQLDREKEEDERSTKAREDMRLILSRQVRKMPPLNASFLSPLHVLHHPPHPAPTFVCLKSGLGIVEALVEEGVPLRVLGGRRGGESGIETLARVRTGEGRCTYHGAHAWLLALRFNPAAVMLTACVGRVGVVVDE